MTVSNHQNCHRPDVKLEEDTSTCHMFREVRNPNKRDCCSLPLSSSKVARSRFAAQLPHAASAGAGAVAGAVWRSRSVCRTPERVYEAL